MRVTLLVLRTLGTPAPTFFGLLAVTFVIGRVVPIDPVLEIVGDRALPEVCERVRQESGLHLPIWQQFLLYLQKVPSGDFGRSAIRGQPVLADIARFFPATVELATAATLLGVLLGVPAGVLAAVYRDRWLDHLVRLSGLVGYSVPVFWLGLMGLVLFYAKLDGVEGPGRLGVAFEDLLEPTTGLLLLDAALAGEWEIFANALGHSVLPASIPGCFSLAYISRMTRSFMLAELRRE